MSLYLILSILSGGAMGLGAMYLTRRLIQNRTSEPVESPLLNRRWTPFIWIIAGALGCGFISLWMKDIISGIEYMAIFLVLMCLGVTDGCIRKIPNELLVALLVIKLGAAIANRDMTALFPALAGFAVGLILFLVPSCLKIGIGWGDIKLAAVAGFCLGLVGFFQAVAVMAIILALYAAYLIATKKGNLKTNVAIGPTLSIGIMAALLFPLAIAM